MDQIEPRAGYRPHNVTLACARCNLKRNAKPAPEETRSLADVVKDREKPEQYGIAPPGADMS